MLSIRLISALSIVAFASWQSAAPPQRAYVPAQTKIAILPVIDASGEKDVKTSKEQCGFVSTELLKEFQERGFRFIERRSIDDVIKNQSIDLSDEEQRKRATMFGIGKEVGADLVAFVLITDKVTGERTKDATIKIWLLDVNHQEPIMSGKPQEGRSNMSNAFNRASWRRAFPFAVEAGLQEFFKPFPKVPKDAQQIVKGGVPQT